MNRQRGFTLFELVLAVASAGIAVTIALPAYQDYSYRTQMAHLLDLMTRDRQVVERYQREHRRWPGDAHPPGISGADAAPYLAQPPTLLTRPKALHYTVSFGNGVSGELLLEAHLQDGEIQDWHCQPLDQTPGFARYLPAFCGAD